MRAHACPILEILQANKRARAYRICVHLNKKKKQAFRVRDAIV